MISQSRRPTRRRRLLVAALVAVLGGLWVGVGLTRVQVDSDIDSLLPAGDRSVRALDTMAATFGGDPVVVLLEGGGDPLSVEHLEGLLALEGHLSALPDVVATYGPATTLNQTVIRIKELLADLSGRRDALSEAGRTADLKAFEKRYGGLLVEAMPSGLPTLRNEGFVRSVVFDQATGRVKPQWRQYVPADGTVAIYLRPREHLDQAAAERLTDRVRRAVAGSDAVTDDTRVTVTGAPVVTTSLATRMRHEVPRLALTAFGVVALVLLLMPWTPRRRVRLAPLLVMAAATSATLATFGWAGDPLSIGAATFLPIILGLGSYYPVYLAQRGHRRLVLAVAASAILAFAGLLLSPLPFVSDLGVAIPVGLGFVVVLSLLVGWVRRAPAPTTGLATPLTRNPAGRSWSRWVAVPLLAVVAAAALGWVALGSVPLKTDPQQLLAGLPALDDAVHVEDVLGYSGEIDVLLRGDDVLTPEALAWSQAAQASVVSSYGDRVRPVVSVGQLLGFLGDSPTAEQVQAGAAAIPDYVASAVVSVDQRESLISFGVAWQSLSDDRGLIDDLTAALPPPPAGYEVQVSGLPVAADRGYELVSGSRYEANVVALLGAFLALVILLPRRSDAVLALAAAATASGLGVFLVHLVGASLNPLTLALGALTAAVGCEFTVLLAAARRHADRSLARSVRLAAVLSIGGYAVLMTSSLPILREFGLALTASVALSLGTALVASRLVRFGSGVPTTDDELVTADAATTSTERELQTAGDPR
jgi:predicted RND superfamily exporter protein